MRAPRRQPRADARRRAAAQTLAWLGVALLLPAACGAERAQMDSLRAVQQAGRAHISEIGVAHKHIASPLPLYERLKREHRVHPRLHPQQYAHERGGGRGGDDPAARRRAQGATANALTVDNTEELAIFVDYSAFYDVSEASSLPVGVKETAMPYSTCFNVGDWFMWNFPAALTPPCASTGDGGSGPAGWHDGMAHSEFIGTNQDGCGGNGGDVFTNNNPDGSMCNREYDSNGQNCWGLCVKEDILQRAREDGCTDTQHRDSNGNTVSHTIGVQGWTADTCNARDWAMEKISEDVREIESYYRVLSLVRFSIDFTVLRLCATGFATVLRLIWVYFDEQGLASGGGLSVTRDGGAFAEIYAASGQLYIEIKILMINDEDSSTEN